MRVTAAQFSVEASDPRENVAITTCDAARRSVREMPAAAAAPSAAVIPGTTSKSTPACAQRFDFFAGAAEDQRIAALQADHRALLAAYETSSALISSCVSSF